MTDIEQGRYDPGPPRTTDDDLPTSAGGTTDIEPQVPGQSLGQTPEHDDDDRDEAGDPHAAGPGTHGSPPADPSSEL
ncbi:MAG: hypothetical protein KF809_00130 [Chloroflexi bacterium]|nr:hypothetical protein [Chloroflexota bacterium]